MQICCCLAAVGVAVADRAALWLVAAVVVQRGPAVDAVAAADLVACSLAVAASRTGPAVVAADPAALWLAAVVLQNCLADAAAVADLAAPWLVAADVAAVASEPEFAAAFRA